MSDFVWALTCCSLSKAAICSYLGMGVFALGDERHLLLECPALADFRTHFSQLIAQSSGDMARLVWFRDQPLVREYIIACLDMVSCY